jgi:23S rRNA (adenine2030-N6)-methyltransferase
MNYRHAFHAGNFADLVKHAALDRLLQRLLTEASPLTVVDTHAGAGLYDLGDPAQQRSREAEAGIKRLMAEALPPEFDGLAAAVRRRNRPGTLTTYPGSPSLILDRLRPGDRYVACELRPDDHGRLAGLFRKSGKAAEARRADGYQTAVEVTRAAPGRVLVLIDPPYERADDYVRIVETAAAVLAARPDAVLLVWLPLKDLETLDAFARGLEAAGLPSASVAEARLRPLHDPMKMNGCALVALGAPAGFDEDLLAVCRFVVAALGDPNGSARLWKTEG